MTQPSGSYGGEGEQRDFSFQNFVTSFGQTKLREGNWLT